MFSAAAMNGDAIKEQRTVLVVEDDDDIARYYASLLEGSCRVVMATTGREAVAHAKETRRFDAVILDYRLPDISGLAVLRAMKRLVPAVPILFVTAYGDEDVAVRAFRCGARDYMKKPFAYGELMERISFCLSLERADHGRQATMPPEEHGLRASEVPEVPSSRSFANIQTARRYIDNNFMLRITLEMAAKKACLSPYHFARVFKKQTGSSFHQYVTRRRIEKAKALLRDSSRSITDIGYSVGYPDLTNFVRNFKKLTSLTPTAFRSRQHP